MQSITPISNTKTFTLGLTVLLVGMIFYFFLRPVESVYFIPVAFESFRVDFKVVAFLSNSLPTFLHVLAFSLLTASIVRANRNIALVICSFWVGINLLFEIGQLSVVSSSVVQQLPRWFEQILVLENTANYFIHGRFDVMDMLAAIVGGLVAYSLLRYIIRTDYP